MKLYVILYYYVRVLYVHNILFYAQYIMCVCVCGSGGKGIEGVFDNK